MRVPLLLVDAAAISSGDTAWVLASTALVMLMTVGLAFFYGGLVRPKNSLNTMMMSVVALGVIGVQWVLVGYSVAFGHGSPLWGGLAWLGFKGVGVEPDAAYAATIPLQAHAMFQGMFAIITPALISGAIVERMRFRAYVVFLVLWATFVYDPLAHWVWGAGGWLQSRGALDFAGGTVVHISAGFSALVAARMLGPRKDFKRVPIVPTTCLSCCSVRGCCGSAGSGSTPARRSPRTAWRPSRSRTPTRRPRRRSSRGRRWTSSGREKPPRSAPRPGS